MLHGGERGYVVTGYDAADAGDCVSERGTDFWRGALSGAGGRRQVDACTGRRAGRSHGVPCVLHPSRSMGHPSYVAVRCYAID